MTTRILKTSSKILRNFIGSTVPQSVVSSVPITAQHFPLNRGEDLPSLCRQRIYYPDSVSTKWQRKYKLSLMNRSEPSQLHLYPRPLVCIYSVLSLYLPTVTPMLLLLVSVLELQTINRRLHTSHLRHYAEWDRTWNWRQRNYQLSEGTDGSQFHVYRVFPGNLQKRNWKIDT